jgi:XTP/dITP diphosphohydrolase
MTRFVLASGNRHKLGEFAAILAPHEVVAMPAGIKLPPEGVVSFAENAAAKARSLATALAAAAPPAAGPSGSYDFFCLADDSGLEVEALGWAPSVTSSRYAGREGDDQANIRKLLAALAALPDRGGRRARFVCSVVAVAPDMREFAATGEWWGTIAAVAHGDGGFGYDPVFIPEGSDLSVAQWPQAEKDQASHRALAGKALLELLSSEGVLHGP